MFSYFLERPRNPENKRTFLVQKRLGKNGLFRRQSDGKKIFVTFRRAGAVFLNEFSWFVRGSSMKGSCIQLEIRSITVFIHPFRLASAIRLPRLVFPHYSSFITNKFTLRQLAYTTLNFVVAHKVSP